MELPGDLTMDTLETGSTTVDTGSGTLDIVLEAD
jgi:hypothetical protein